MNFSTMNIGALVCTNIDLFVLFGISLRPLNDIHTVLLLNAVKSDGFTTGYR